MAWKPEHGIYMDAKYNLVYPEGATHLDGIPEDVLEFIHPHWGKYPPQHPLVVHVVGIAFFFLWLLSFLGNGSVIYVFLKVIRLCNCTLDIFLSSDSLSENAKQHVRCEPRRLRLGDDDNDGSARDCQRVHPALLDVGQAFVRRLWLPRGCLRHLFHPQHGRHWL